MNVCDLSRRYDGRFSFSLQKIDPRLDEFFQTLRSKVKIGIVGGSDYPKIAEQLGEGDDGENSVCKISQEELDKFTDTLRKFSAVGLKAEQR